MVGLDNSNCIAGNFLPISPHVLFDKTVYLTNFLPRVNDYTVDWRPSSHLIFSVIYRYVWVGLVNFL